MISASSVHYQHITSESSAHQQCIIKASTAHHHCTISASSMHQQGINSAFYELSKLWGGTTSLLMVSLKLVENIVKLLTSLDMQN